MANVLEGRVTRLPELLDLPRSTTRVRMSILVEGRTNSELTEDDVNLVRTAVLLVDNPGKLRVSVELVAEC